MTSYGPVTPPDDNPDENEPNWLGHRDMCSLQWSDRCNCNDPIEPDPTCSTCHGRTWVNGQWVAQRETVGMVCPECGFDYAPQAQP